MYKAIIYVHIRLCKKETDNLSKNGFFLSLFSFTFFSGYFFRNVRAEKNIENLDFRKKLSKFHAHECGAQNIQSDVMGFCACVRDPTASVQSC